MGPPVRQVHVAHLPPPRSDVVAVRPGRLKPLIDRISKSVLELRWRGINCLFHCWIQTQIVLLINDCLVANPPGLRSTIHRPAGPSTIIHTKAVSQVVQIKAVQVKVVGRAVQSKPIRKAVQVMAVSQAVQIQSNAVLQAVLQAVLTTAGKLWRVGGGIKPEEARTDNPLHRSKKSKRVQLVFNF